ncbi:hypothetical protein HHI36_013413, partial [Cryptolaemus montrouzieri]
MKLVSTKINVPAIENCIDSCFRVHFAPKDKKPRPIVVTFRNKMLCSDFLKAYKHKGELNANEIGSPRELNRVYTS